MVYHVGYVSVRLIKGIVFVFKCGLLKPVIICSIWRPCATVTVTRTVTSEKEEKNERKRDQHAQTVTVIVTITLTLALSVPDIIEKRISINKNKCTNINNNDNQ